MPEKDGLWTTEFWLTLIHQMVALGMLIRIIPYDIASAFENSANIIVPAVAVVAGQVVVLYKYMQTRLELKQPAAPEPAPAVVQVLQPAPVEAKK